MAAGTLVCSAGILGTTSLSFRIRDAHAILQTRLLSATRAGSAARLSPADGYCLIYQQVFPSKLTYIYQVYSYQLLLLIILLIILIFLSILLLYTPQEYHPHRHESQGILRGYRKHTSLRPRLDRAFSVPLRPLWQERRSFPTQ